MNEFPPSSPDFPSSSPFPPPSDFPSSSPFPPFSDFASSSPFPPSSQFPGPSQPPVFGGPRRLGSIGPRGGIIGLIVAIIAILIGIIIAVNVHSGMSVSHKGPCMGGPVMGSSGEPVGHGNYRFPCADGGSTVVHLGG